METSLGPTYKPEDGSYEWQLHWVLAWREDKLAAWGVFTRLIGELEGSVVEGEKTKILKAYVKDGWKKEKQEAKQEWEVHEPLEAVYIVYIMSHYDCWRAEIERQQDW